MYGGVGVLGQALVIDVAQVVAELVVALVERLAGSAAVQCGLLRVLMSSAPAKIPPAGIPAVVKAS